MPLGKFTKLLLLIVLLVACNACSKGNSSNKDALDPNCSAVGSNNKTIEQMKKQMK